MNKRIIFLANSKKYNGKCVAGKELSTGEWVRPISRRISGEISQHEECLNEECMQYKTFCNCFKSPQMLDVLDVKVLKKTSYNHQTENYIISRIRWEKVGEVDFYDLEDYLDNDKGDLWYLGSSTYNGLNDRVPLEYIENYHDSLRLIEPETFKVVVTHEYNRDVVRAKFQFLNKHYAIKVTDPILEEFYLSSGKSEYRYRGRNVRICISLAETPYQGFFYKLVAGIIIK